MAKRQSVKRSVKRAFKKRSTIRKFRKTMRRYAQSGGSSLGAIALIAGFAMSFVVLKSPKLMALLSLLGMNLPKAEDEAMTGAGIRHVHGSGMRGGGLREDMNAIAEEIKAKAEEIKTKASAIASGSAQSNGEKTSPGNALRTIVANTKQTVTTAAGNAVNTVRSAAKQKVINSLETLRVAFNDDEKVTQATKNDINRCVAQLKAKIDLAKEPASVQPSTTEVDIAKSVGDATDESSDIPEVLPLSDKVKLFFSKKIDLLRSRYNTAMENKIISFKAKYQLNDDDMKCIRVLKDAVLNDMIQKKETLIDNIKNSPTAKKAISIAQVASDTLAKGSAVVKERLGLLAASNPNAAAMAAALKNRLPSLPSLSSIPPSFRGWGNSTGSP